MFVAGVLSAAIPAGPMEITCSRMPTKHTSHMWRVVHTAQRQLCARVTWSSASLLNAMAKSTANHGYQGDSSAAAWKGCG
jgi:hypothetical protein